MEQERLAAVNEPMLQERMLEIGPGLFHARQAKIFRHWAAAKVDVLREDEPHPVAAFAAIAKLGERLFVDPARLRVDEALQVERVSARHLIFASAPAPPRASWPHAATNRDRHERRRSCRACRSRSW